MGRECARGVLEVIVLEVIVRGHWDARHGNAGTSVVVWEAKLRRMRVCMNRIFGGLRDLGPTKHDGFPLWVVEGARDESLHRITVIIICLRLVCWVTGLLLLLTSGGFVSKDFGPGLSSY